MIEFNASPLPTLGVELELQLLNPDNLAFTPVGPRILDEINPDFKHRIKVEFTQSMIELNTGICGTVKEVDSDLRQSLAHLEGLLDKNSACYYSASLHPFEQGRAEEVSDHPRYKRIMNELQKVGRQFIAQGLHIHVGVDTPERTIRITNMIRIYLPLLLALSTSSPYFGGEDTGLYSFRSVLFNALPMTGIPDSYDNWESFSKMTELLMAGGIIEGARDLWWDVRPHPDFGTVEVRICDVPCRYAEILALSALVQALVVTIMNLTIHPDVNVQMQILKANKWQAVRHGLDGTYVNPISADRMPIRDAIREMLDLVRPEAQNLGTTAYLDTIMEILKHGTGAHKQRALYAKTNDFAKMISAMQEGFFK